ncbi:PLP-dependent cysteine synthase family protein [Helicobacter typhlonius]|uniref:Cysteine synthase n=6 Tax=Helicobacter typhlonius TaxID=76936 RepID=A0A099UGJ8_9HELI|nr:cysteine synthase family protein [Helicobacter typhlonius]TLD78448.1 cysteine synthase family protein [Helicobacter typhlonius]CUU39688.1 Cystathionine beta-synthase [Helicobacter typhlonius]
MIFTSTLELIGNTPLLELKAVEIPNNNRIFAKLEYYNPAGGVKDRVALYVFQKLRDEGKLTKDSVVIEATAGNTGLGIALVAQHFGCKAILVVPDKFSIEKQILAKALGAEVINTPKEQGMQGAIDEANALLSRTKNAFSLNQFENLNNPYAHYLSTAVEIYTDMQTLNPTCVPPFDYFVCGAGSGGSFSGCARYFKEQDFRIKAVLADPLDSVIGKCQYGHECGYKCENKCVCTHIEGIGNAQIPKTMDTSLIDMVEKISDEEAYNGLKILTRQEGILAGISSGATLSAALKVANKVQGAKIVTLFADELGKYFSHDAINSLIQ